MMRIAFHLGTGLSVAGLVAFFASALAMVVFWVVALSGWLGWIGTVVGVLTAPAAVVFPFVHWFVEGAPTALHFWIWGSGVAGLIVAMTWMGMHDPAEDPPVVETAAATTAVEPAEERTA